VNGLADYIEAFIYTMFGVIIGLFVLDSYSGGWGLLIGVVAVMGGLFLTYVLTATRRTDDLDGEDK
jgi:hypothetical protein